MFQPDVVLTGTAERIRAASEAQITPDGAQCGFDDECAIIEDEARGFLRRLHRHARARELGQTIARGVLLRVSVRS